MHACCDLAGIIDNIIERSKFFFVFTNHYCLLIYMNSAAVLKRGVKKNNPLGCQQKDQRLPWQHIKGPRGVNFLIV